MKLGTEDKKKLITLAVAGTFGLAGAIYIYTQLNPGAPAPPPPPVITGATSRAVAPSSAAVAAPVAEGHAADKVATTSAAYDPTLKMEAMLVTESLVYSGSGRNIFSAASAPVPITIPKIIAPARPGPVIPTPVVQQGPPPPPPIDLKYFGTDTLPNGSRQAFLLHGEDVFVARTGDIVQRRYKVGTISANTIEVEDLTNNNRQMLPLLK